MRPAGPVIKIFSSRSTRSSPRRAAVAAPRSVRGVVAMSPVPSSLDAAIGRSLDGLLHALVLEPVGDDRFRVQAEPDRFTRVFGGQSVAQALLAAAETVDDKA